MKTFSVLTYNLCLGLKGNTFWDAYNSTYRVFHGRKDPQEILAKVNFEDLFARLKELRPDIVVLNEILDDLTSPQLISFLKGQGFTSVFIGHSGHHKKPICVSTLVATKETAQQLPDALTFPPTTVAGTGGGAVTLEIPALGLCLVGFHLAFKKEYIGHHIAELDAFYERIKDVYPALLFVGDLNRSPEFYKKRSRFGKEMQHAISERTFPSFFPFYKPFSFLSENILIGAVDNIFYRGNLRVRDTKVIKGRSDHKMAYVTFELRE